ncbi:MAG: cupin domain-containing protein [Gemmatimonadota bacterium]
MSSLDRAMNGDVLVRHVTQDERMIDQALLERHGRSSRTLIKEGPLRLTIVALAADGELAAHRAPGPATMHILEGNIVFAVAGKNYDLTTGDILVMAAGVEHSARSPSGGVFLLTVVDLRPDKQEQTG